MTVRGERQQWMMGMHPTTRNDPAPDSEGGTTTMNNGRNDQAPNSKEGTMTTNDSDAPNNKE